MLGFYAFGRKLPGGGVYSKSLASPRTYPEPQQARPNTVPGNDPIT